MALTVAVLLTLGGCKATHGLPTAPVDHDGDTVMVMVAARDLYPGVTLEPVDLVAIEMPPVYLPAGVFLSPEHVVGRTPRRRILANELIRAERLASPEQAESLADLVPREMRIAQVPAAGVVPRPGSYVDVWARPPGGGAPCGLLQGVFVMGVDGQRDPKPSASQVQVLVTASQALRLATHSSPTLALRNDTDVAFAPEVQCSL